MKTFNINMDNPLSKYKMANPMMNWSDVEEKTKIPVVSLIGIAKKDKESIKTMRLGTYLLIKEALGVDLLDF